MSIIDNTLAAQVPQFDAVTPLRQVAQLQAQQQEIQQAQFKQKQTEIGAEMRGVAPFVNSPDFPDKWGEAADRLLQRGVIDPQVHERIRNSPSPLMLKSIISQTDTPEMAQRKEQSVQDQKNTEFNQNIALRTANRADKLAEEEKTTIKEVANPDGTSSFVRIKTAGPEGPIKTGLAPSTPANPFSVGPKLNTDQSKSATMVDRMDQANGVITKNEKINDDAFGYLGGTAAAIPKVRDSAVFNTLASPERQQVIQAQRNFVNAILRVESGAAISQSEFDNAQRQYFPQPGDSKEVIAQKRQNRVTAMQGMAREAGPNYKPPADLINAGKPSATDPLGIR